MSIKDPEKEIVTLPRGQKEWPIQAQRRELERRLRVADEEPGSLEPWAGTIERIRARLREIRHQKAARP